MPVFFYSRVQNQAKSRDIGFMLAKQPVTSEDVVITFNLTVKRLAI
ncbi:hypothetical protein E6C60_2127 [Paenibacillus algicola]|uniref:Uncharacterized protein n=1 Tax=Paenibacillus algicola TaxID=2565926 RepID=A0A4P8XJL1_9BACL|nr:hypothetical protein E6C60_2127 [Paenibacillus algicola]